jgi:hypothetical protein
MINGLSESNPGTGFGLFRSLYLLVGALGMTVVGTTADATGWRLSFGLLAALLGVVLSRCSRGVQSGQTCARVRGSPRGVETAGRGAGRKRS